MEKEIDKVLGLVPKPDATFELTAEEYSVFLASKKHLLKVVEMMESIEAKFLSQNTLSYFYESDVITEGGRKFVRKDFWQDKSK